MRLSSLNAAFDRHGINEKALAIVSFEPRGLSEQEANRPEMQ
jgi:hypothetical protein